MADDERAEAAQSTADILKRSDSMADEFERLLRESESLMEQLRRKDP